VLLGMSQGTHQEHQKKSNKTFFSWTYHVEEWCGGWGHERSCMKEGSLFACLVYYVEIFESIAPVVVLLIPLESSWRGVVCKGGLAIFRPMVQELLNIEQFCWIFYKKILKSKLHVFEKFGLPLCIFGKLSTSRI
jgi:hypothetical protein